MGVKWVYIVWVDGKIHACWRSAVDAARSVTVSPKQALSLGRKLIALKDGESIAIDNRVNVERRLML